MEKQAADWEKIFSKDIADKAFLSKVYKELKTQQLENVQIQFNNRPKTLTILH